MTFTKETEVLLALSGYTNFDVKKGVCYFCYNRPKNEKNHNLVTFVYDSHYVLTCEEHIDQITGWKKFQ